MSATDEHEIKLEPRYPESRHEDITDAFMRGHLKACETSFKAIEELEAMNKRLRKENDTLCRRIDELCRENEKLMGELADAPKCDACEAMLDCDECLRADGSHKERRRLSAENAKLRVERDEWRRVAVSKQDIIDHTRDANAENAKLRGLCKELAEFLTEAEWLQWPELRAEMQRLGVEVG